MLPAKGVDGLCLQLHDDAVKGFLCPGIAENTGKLPRSQNALRHLGDGTGLMPELLLWKRAIT